MLLHLLVSHARHTIALSTIIAYAARSSHLLGQRPVDGGRRETTRTLNIAASGHAIDLTDIVAAVQTIDWQRTTTTTTTGHHIIGTHYHALDSSHTGHEHTAQWLEGCQDCNRNTDSPTEDPRTHEFCTRICGTNACVAAHQASITTQPLITTRDALNQPTLTNHIGIWNNREFVSTTASLKLLAANLVGSRDIEGCRMPSNPNRVLYRWCMLQAITQS
jgi:hypothetical protein